MRAAAAILAGTIAACLSATPLLAGCADAAAPCRIEAGSYHIVLADPPQPEGPAIVFLHGWAASGVGVLRMSAMVQEIQARGYALILPDGLPRTDGPGQSWAFLPDEPSPRDETTFLDAVADDAAGRFDLDRQRMLLSGYSIGGSMTSYVACSAPGFFAAYAPVAGGFWRPHPEACAGPVRLFHTHGWTDQTVPLEGRKIDEGFVQGDVFATFEIWRRTLGCGNRYPDATSVDDELWLRSWTKCAAGGELMVALHPGGHSVPAGWVDKALDWFEQTKRSAAK